ncbi:MAG: hypothetical protein U0230_26035 [Polyangiales bacterium]
MVRIATVGLAALLLGGCVHPRSRFEQVGAQRPHDRPCHRAVHVPNIEVAELLGDDSNVTFFGVLTVSMDLSAREFRSRNIISRKAAKRGATHYLILDQDWSRSVVATRTSTTYQTTWFGGVRASSVTSPVYGGRQVYQVALLRVADKRLAELPPDLQP